MNKKRLGLVWHFTFILLICCSPLWLSGQEITEDGNDAKSDKPSTFALYISYGDFNVIRNSDLFTSPFIKNDFHSFGAGIMTYLANKKVYKFKFYLGYLRHGVIEEYTSVAGEQFTSELQFNTVQSAIHPLNLSIPLKKFRLYVGAGGYANYNLGYSLSISPSTERTTNDDLFLPFTYGAVAQAGISISKIDFEINAYNSISDIIDTNLTESPSYVGITAQLVFNF